MRLQAMSQQHIMSKNGMLSEQGTNENINDVMMQTVGSYYSSSRLILKTANVVYPYSTVGKLFFTIPQQGDFYCSASVINYRVVLTYHKGQAPVGRWFGDYVAVHAEWLNGGDTIPNEADYGMIELKGHVVVDGTKKQIAAYTGHLGYRTESLNCNQAHFLGYASNLDSGQQMHQVTGETGRTIAAKNVEYGSDTRNGSEGSPWVQNFCEQGEGEDPDPQELIKF